MSLESDLKTLSDDELQELKNQINKRIDDARFSYESYRQSVNESAKEYLDAIRKEEESRKYTEQPCRLCTNMVMVPPWFKPFSDLCYTCRPLEIEKYAGLDNEPEEERNESDTVTG